MLTGFGLPDGRTDSPAGWEAGSVVERGCSSVSGSWRWRPGGGLKSARLTTFASSGDTDQSASREPIPQTMTNRPLGVAASVMGSVAPVSGMMSAGMMSLPVLSVDDVVSSDICAGGESQAESVRQQKISK